MAAAQNASSTKPSIGGVAFDERLDRESVLLASLPRTTSDLPPLIAIGDYPRLLERIGQLRRGGFTIKEVARRLNQEGYRTPRSRKGYTPTSVRKLLSRHGQKTQH